MLLWHRSPAPAPATGEAAADELAQSRLDAWAQQWRAAQDGRVQHTTPALAALRDRFEQLFIPPWETISSAGAKDFRIKDLVPSIYLPYKNDALQKRIEDNAVLGLPTPTLPAVMLCFGACAQESHERAAFNVLVEIDHDAEGRPERWRVVESSGVREFDNAALMAVRDTGAWDVASTGGDENVAVWSQWQFDAQAYRWSRVEMLLDPQFVPPGRKVDSQSGALGTTTVTTGVRLVAVRFAAG